MKSITPHRQIIQPAHVFNAQGFVLPLTLWMIAVVGLLASVINTWVASTVANSQALAQRVQVELVQSDTRNAIAYFLARRPISYRGLEVGPAVSAVGGNSLDGLFAGPIDSGKALKMDGKAYALAEDPNIIVKIQDEAGLININTVPQQTIRRMLAVFDVPEPQINRLTDALLDYIDDDDLTRQAGAEKTEYVRLNLRPPTNAELTTPYEAQRVMGWDKLSALWKSDMETPLLTTCRTGALNLNTAPVDALIATIPGMTRDKAEAVVARREQKPYRSAREVGAVADVLLADEPFFYGFIPGQCLLVDVIDKRSGQQSRFSLGLDRASQLKPWRINYAVRIPSADRATLAQINAESTFPTPESVDLPSGRNVPGIDGQ